MLAVGFQCAGQLQNLVQGQPAGCKQRMACHSWATLRERARLVEHDHLDFVRPLQTISPLPAQFQPAQQISNLPCFMSSHFVISHM